MNKKSQFEILGIEPFSPNLETREALVKSTFNNREYRVSIDINVSDPTGVAVYHSDYKYKKLGNMIDCTLPDGKNLGQLEVGDILFCNIATGKIE